MHRRQMLFFTATAAAATIFGHTAFGQGTFPNRPFRLLVPFSPGGATDLLARALGKDFTLAWRQPAIVENRSSAGGVIAGEAVLEAPPDGYTLLVHSDGFTVAPAVMSHMPYDSSRDFLPLGMLAQASNVVTVGMHSPYTRLEQLIAAGQGGKPMSFGSAGVGSAMHMQSARFVSMTHMKGVIHVPYRGTPEVMTATLAGQVDFIFAPISAGMPYYQNKQLRPLAVTSSKRSPFLPDVPTVQEAGLSGYVAEQFWGVSAPAKIDPAIAAKLTAQIRAAAVQPAMRRLLTDLFSQPGDLFGTPFADRVRADIASNTTFAQSAGITT